MTGVDLRQALASRQTATAHPTNLPLIMQIEVQLLTLIKSKQVDYSKSLPLVRVHDYLLKCFQHFRKIQETKVKRSKEEVLERGQQC